MVAAVTEGIIPSVLEGVRRFLALYPGLGPGDRVTTDLTEEKPGSLALSPAGEEAVKEDVAGNREITRSYWLYRSCLAADEADRRENQEFLEGMAGWILERNETEELPLLPAGCRAEGLRAGEIKIMESSGGRGRSYRMRLVLTYTEKRRG